MLPTETAKLRDLFKLPMYCLPAPIFPEPGQPKMLILFTELRHDEWNFPSVYSMQLAVHSLPGSMRAINS